MIFDEISADPASNQCQASALSRSVANRDIQDGKRTVIECRQNPGSQQSGKTRVQPIGEFVHDFIAIDFV